MAEQASGTVEGREERGHAAARCRALAGHNPGRPISWVGTSIVIVGFIVGGIAMVPSPHWLFFWIGAGVAIVGCLILRSLRL